jgi:multiple sugar transport system substrate-binding protein
MLRKGLLIVVVLLFGALAFTPAVAQNAVFTYWGGLIFSETANQLLVDRINAWGAERGVPVEVVMINQNETVQRVSAAVEAGTMPDAFDAGLDFMLLLALNGQIDAATDIYEAIGEGHGGWTESLDTALRAIPGLDGELYGVPFAVNGNVLYRRNDILRLM